ncbi:HIT domain-containing protein [Candidatus Woesearchaeota archaeon]|nr:HIT domain-containing protein [Candidatus Woesearchaeota archaeon]
MAKEDCLLCSVIDNKVAARKVYEDKDVLAILHPTPASVGHILVMPKEHLAIFEQLTEFTTGRLFQVTNKLSSVVFEALQMEGTNIIISNGTAAEQKWPHFTINLIPRRSQDGLNFAWSPRQFNEDDMGTAELKLKAEAKKITEEVLEDQAEPPVIDTKVEHLSGTEEDNYQIRQLRRMP